MRTDEQRGGEPIKEQRRKENRREKADTEMLQTTSAEEDGEREHSREGAAVETEKEERRGAQLMKNSSTRMRYHQR